MALTKKILTEEYESYKRLAFKFYAAKKYNKALRVARQAAHVAWRYPILHSFSDEELEGLLIKISAAVLENKDEPNTTKVERKIVFYSSEIMDSNQLTEQFLSYFIERKLNVLFIVPNNRIVHLGKRILRIISESSNIEFYIPQVTTDTERILQIYDKISCFSPSHAFLQFLPDDVIGFSVFAAIKKPDKYFIDITGHSFQLGKLCSHYFIEIHKLYWLIAAKRRKIDTSKLFYLDIYPIMDKSKFQGFPFDRTGKIVGVSGGQIYKYQADSSLKYFESIKELIKANPDFVFCLALSGKNPDLIQSFIKTNNLENKIYLVGRRTDFYELVRNSDIYFESYPVKGGLSPMFAVANKIPITGIAVKDNVSGGGIEDILDIENYKQCDSIEGFFLEADKLIKSKEERENRAALFKGCKKTKYYFDKGLDEILNGINTRPDLFKNEILHYNDEKTLTEYLAWEKDELRYYLEKLYYFWSYIGINECLIIMFNLIRLIRDRKQFRLLIYYFASAIELAKNNVLTKLRQLV